MNSIGLLDALPLWGVFAGSALLVVISLYIGFKLGAFERSRIPDESTVYTGNAVGSALGACRKMATIAASTSKPAAT